MKKEQEDGLIVKLGGILDILICLLLFMMSMYKGGFYKADTAFSNLLIEAFGLAIIIVKLVRNIRNNSILKRSILVSILDGLMIAMPICYLLPIIFKTYANIEGSITEFLTYANFSIIYFITRSTKNKSYYINTIIVIGVALALLGIDELTTRDLEKIISNISIAYVSENTGRLAATLQYANVTALILLLSSQLVIYKLIEIDNRDKQSTDYFEKYKKMGYSFLIILLNCSVVLTNSRMAVVLLLISNIAIAIYLLKHKMKNIAATSALLFLSSIFVANLVETSISNLEYTNVSVIFILVFLTICVVYFLANSSKIQGYVIDINNKIKDRWGLGLRKSIAIVLPIVIIFSILSVIYFENPSLVIKGGVSGKNVQGRNIYNGYVIGENRVEIVLKSSNETKYNLYVYEIYDDFTRATLAKTNDFKITKNSDGTESLTTKAKVLDKTKNLRISTTVNSGSVEIKSLKINDKEIRLTYSILPDSLVFKLKDTFNHDQNNNLREEYFKDAVKLIKISPLLGLGGEGFLARYQGVQTKSYISSEAHSNILQICVESGILGGSIFIAIIIITLSIILKSMKLKQDKSLIYVLLIVFLSYLITATFDITMSFQLLVLIFAIIIGITVSESFEKFKNTENNMYMIDNKSIIGLLKICVLTISLLTIGISTYYSYNVYRSGMINIEAGLSETDVEQQLQKSYTDILAYEKKLQYDKYNIKYAMELNELYTDHIKLVTKISITETNKQTKAKLEKDVIYYTIKQKNVVDNLIEYDYYDKYVLELAAKNYFNNFLAYSNIYEGNFTIKEVAYAFYLGYAMNLTRRIEQVGPYNKVAKNMLNEIYSSYYDSLSTKNTYIKSEVIDSVLKDIKSKINNKGD